MSPDPFPVIDFTNPHLKPGTPEWESVKSQVKKAAQDYGCFKALYKKIPMELQQAIFQGMKELFDLPLETKKRNVPDVRYSGYNGTFPDSPLMESLAFYGPDDSLEKSAELFTFIFWPEGKPNFSKTMQSFSRQVVNLEKIVKRMIVESFGLEKYWEELSNGVNYLFRVIKYQIPQNETKDKIQGLHTHRDKTSFTILYQNEVDGLEVETKDGEWFKLELQPNTPFVMVGDSFRAWTNNLLASANHRVTMDTKEARYTCGLFSGFKLDFEIKAPEELVDEEHPRQFKPYKFHDFLSFERTTEQKKLGPELEVFCAV